MKKAAFIRSASVFGRVIRHQNICRALSRLYRPLSGLVHPDLFSSDPSLVDASVAPLSFDPRTLVVYPNVCTTEEEHAFLRDLEPTLKRKRYQKGHWDSVIKNYKETELLSEVEDLSNVSRVVMERIRTQLVRRHSRHPETVQFLPSHTIDLHANGELNAHVDSIRFSGDIVAGLSLLSTAIMRFVPAPQPSSEENYDMRIEPIRYIDALLPPRSLYVMAGSIRYDYTHEILPTGSSFAGGAPLTRARRLSIIFRDTKNGKYSSHVQSINIPNSAYD